MSSAPTVSVVTAFYNRAQYVRESVGSLLEQTFRDMEVVVVDDGSSDGTPDELEKLRDPRLKVIVQANAGFVAAMNRGICESRGRYVAVHGSGDISLPGRFEAQAAYLDAHPEIGVVGCSVRVGQRVVGPWKKAIERGPLLPVALDRNPFSHGEVMFRRSLFDQVGGYRPAFRFAQDRDLWLRMGRHCEYAILPEPYYERRYLANAVSRNPDQVIMQKKLAQFAVQNARSIDPNGRDLLDRFGPAAFFMTEPTRKLSNFFTRDGLRWLRDGRVAGGVRLLKAGWREDQSLYALAGRVVASLVTVPAFIPLLQWPLRLLTGPADPEH